MSLLQRAKERLQLNQDYRETFSTPNGERVLKHILSSGGVTRPRFSASNELTRINEGERRLAFSIYRMAKATGTKELPDYIDGELDNE